MARSRRQKIRTGLAKARPAKQANRAAVGPARPAPRGPTIGLGQAQPAASGSASPAAPADPRDSVYYSELAGAGKRRDTALGDIASSRNVAEQRFGLSGAHGNTKANPYSLAAVLQDRQQLGQRGVRNSAGLQIYSGSTRQKQTNVDSGYAKSLADLRAQRARAIADFLREEGDVKRAYDEAKETAYARAIGRSS